MIKQRWPLWIKLLLSPIAVAGAILSAPIIALLIVADFDKAEALMSFWIDPS